jgi:hypothetical protein
MTVTSIEEFYIGYFGRAADPAGLNYFLTEEAAGVSDQTIALQFAGSAEAIANYPQLATPLLLQGSPAAQANFLNAVYQNLFGHAADAAGLTYWEGQLAAGVQAGLIVYQIINGALGADATALASKAGVATSYTNAVLTAVPPITFDQNDITQSKSILAGVTNPSTAAATGPAIANAITSDESGNNGVAGATLTLGAGDQVFSPTASGGLQTTGGNTFRGVSVTSSYLATTDSITGDGGFNTINSVLDLGGGGIKRAELPLISAVEAEPGSNIVAPVLIGIQAVNLDPTGPNQTFNGATSTGVQTLSVAAGLFPDDGDDEGVTLSVTGFSTATAMGMMNNLNTSESFFEGSTSLPLPEVSDAEPAAAPDSLFVSFTGLSATATNTATLVLAGNGNATAGGGTFDTSISSAGVGVNTLNVSSTGGANFVTIGTTDAALGSIVITGSASLTMLEANTNVTTINGSAATGNLAITTVALTGKATISGGSGNDTLNASAAAKSVTITDGAGTDTMIVNGANAANVITAGSGLDTAEFTPPIDPPGAGLTFISAADTSSNATLTGDLNVLNNYTAGNTKIDLPSIASTSLDTTINPTSLANALSAAQSLLQAVNNVAALVTQQGASGTPVVAFAYGGNEYVFQDNAPGTASLTAGDGVLQVTGAAGTFKTSDINFAGGQIEVSDRRLKRDIRPVGVLSNGLKLYSYRYVWGATRVVGVMADEVESVMPSAVVTHRSGYKMVDYGKLLG